MPHDTYQSYHRFKAITFDTSSCRDDYRARLGVMTKELQMLTPDILLLQNVFATADDRYNTAAHLARQLRMHGREFGEPRLDVGALEQPVALLRRIFVGKAGFARGLGRVAVLGVMAAERFVFRVEKEHEQDPVA